MGIKHLALHCHSDQSIKDGAQTPTELVNRVKELGGTAVTLTDHGVLTGTFEFLQACKDAGIKGIPGVEAYISEDGENVRRHLILLAKDKIGYKAIEKAVTESNKRLVVLRTKTIPTMNKDILVKWFGPGSVGHDHVIATSACVQGVIASELTFNSEIEKIIHKKISLRDKYTDPMNGVYLSKKNELNALLAKQDRLKEEIKVLKTAANLSTKKAESYLKKHEGMPDYADLKRELDEQYARKDAAAKELKAKMDEQNILKKAITNIRKEVKAFEDSIKKYEAYNESVKELEAQQRPDKELMDNAAREAEWYRSTFGANNFFMELQYHGYSNEAFVFPKLCFIARNLGIPCVPANDAHYTKKEDARRRAIIVADSFKTTIDALSIDSELYIKTDEELADMLKSIIAENFVNDAFDNLKLIADACNVELPFEEHYPKYNKIPEGMTDVTYLRQLAYEGIPNRYPGGVGADGSVWDQEHIDRLEYELKVMESMNVCNYHLVVQDYLNYGKSLAYTTEEKVGYTIGPGRGSAVGSLVCYLLGITNLDPIKYSLFFERYLNTERVSMPDIDSDFANGIREDCIEYMRRTYGSESVCGVTTKQTLKMKNAIRLAGRINPITTKDLKRVVAITNEIPGTAKSFKKPYNPNDPLLGTVEEHLLSVFKDPVEQQIIRDAVSIEGLTVGYGRHAAAVIISDTGDVSDQVALMQTEGNWAVQCVKEEAEANAGLLKMDFLGLINLDVITETLRKIYRNTGRRIDMDTDVKFDDNVFKGIFFTGNTDAVFQFSSDGMKKMLKDFRPSCFEDLILLVAAYRPGPMQYLPDIIAAKHGIKKIEYSIPELESILNSTYGKTVYQEQVQEIFKKLAGYSLGQADLVRRAMSKKKVEKLEHERKAFLYGDESRNIKGCVANGINETAANQLFNEMMDFASYAFNKSHAAAYALVAYQTAWLKHYYPAEYMASVMEFSKYEKLPMYILNCKDMGLKLEAPDINTSVLGFAASEGVVKFGFKAMKGVGNKDTDDIIEERRKGEFKDLRDFVIRTDISKDTFYNLINGGAFDIFNKNRRALTDYGTDLREKKKFLINAKSKWETAKNELSETSTDKEIKKVAKLEEAYNEAKSNFENCMLNMRFEDRLSKLRAEKEILGDYITDHPVNGYKLPANSLQISKISENFRPYMNAELFGIVTDLKVLTIKNGTNIGKKFCTFKLDDGTGTIKVTMFQEAYEKLKGIIKENDVQCFKGQIKEEKFTVKTVDSYLDDENETEEEEKISYVFIANDIGEIQKKHNSIVLEVPNVIRWFDMAEELFSLYNSPNGEGLNLIVYDRQFSELRRTGHVVTEDILKNTKYKISKTTLFE